METTCSKKSKNESSVCSSNPWGNRLPPTVLKIIPKNHLSSLGDRVRVGAVCRQWNLVLKPDILGIPEAPWKILLEEFPNIPFTPQLTLESLSDRKIYRFNVPNRGWFCGSSRGWLLMASGVKLKPDLYLWNPLNGTIRNLPPLSSHPFYNRFRLAQKLRTIDIWRVFDRVQVFSHHSADCAVVVAILNKLVCPRNQISFCTSGDSSWSTYTDKEDETIYVDLLYHRKSGLLWLLTADADSNRDAMEKTEIRLSGCTVPIRFVFLKEFKDVDALYDPVDIPWRSCIRKKDRQVFRLVEDEDGGVLVVVTNLDRHFCCHHPNGGHEVVMRDQTGQVSFFDRSGELTSIGNRTVFLGSTSTNSIIISNPMGGIETDCLYLFIEDSTGRYRLDNKQRDSHANSLFIQEEGVYRHASTFHIREEGVYSLKSKQIRYSTAPTAVVCLAMDTPRGWFEPKILLK